SILSVEGTATPVALDVHLQNDRVVDQAIDRGNHHGVIREDLVPRCERLIRGDKQRATLVASADQLEQNTGFRMIFVDIGRSSRISSSYLSSLVRAASS